MRRRGPSLRAARWLALVGLCRVLVLVSFLVLVLVLFLVVGVLGARPARAQVPESPASDVRVRVTAVAGEHAFIEPGGAAGLYPGAIVVFGGARFEVEQVARASASVRIGAVVPAPLQLGDEGTLAGPPRIARDARPETATLTRREARPLAVYRGQWPDARPPAEDQRPQHVSLSPELRTNQRLQLVLSGSQLAQLPLGSTQRAYGRTELRAQLRAQPMDLPLVFDVDAALQLYLGGGMDMRAGSASRPIVRVRALQAVYGERGSFFAAVGRLRYAAPLIGTLDGASVLSPAWRGFQIGAFGGFPPDPRTSAPSIAAARFGVVAQYEDSESPLRPSGTLVVHGSVFGGQVDERRLNLAGSIFPGNTRVGGHLELSLYDAIERFTTKRLEVSAAGADFSTRLGDLDLSARFDMRKPDRSRWLDAQLPPGWLCLAVPSARTLRDAEDENCDGNDARYVGSLTARYALGRARLALGGSLVHTQGASGLERASAFATLRQALGADGTTFVEATVSAGGGLLLESYAGGIAAGGLLLHETLELSGRYRGTVGRYRADLGYWNQQRVGMTAEWRGPATLRLDVDAWLALDVRGVSVFLTAVWRVL